MLQPLLRRRHHVLAHEQIEQPDDDRRIVLDRRQVADAPRRERDHLLEPLLASPGERPQPATEIVVQHEIPAPEHLLGEKLRNRCRSRRAVMR